jgi:four helix bundle protein
MNVQLQKMANTSLSLAVEVLKLYEGFEEKQKRKYPSKQMARYGMQTGSKIARCGGNFKQPDFIGNFTVACRRCDQIKYWLKAVYELGYISQIRYLELSMKFEALYDAMDDYMKKVKMYRAIKTIGRYNVLNEKMLNFN